MDTEDIEADEKNLHIIICGPTPQHIWKYGWTRAGKKANKIQIAQALQIEDLNLGTVLQSSIKKKEEDEQRKEGKKEEEEVEEEGGLEEEIFIKIFSYLERKDLCNVRLVCKDWYQMCHLPWLKSMEDLKKEREKKKEVEKKKEEEKAKKERYSMCIFLYIRIYIYKVRYIYLYIYILIIISLTWLYIIRTSWRFLKY